MSEREGETPGEVPRRPRPSVEVPPSVLRILESRTGEAPRVSLRDEGSAAGGSPPIDPASPERDARPTSRQGYQILGEIARGGMGVVLRGHDSDLGRDVAMKVLAKELAHRPEVVQRFVEEAQIGGQLQHPGIVPVYELGLMADERPYFAMKLVKGRTLAMLLAERASPASDRRHMVEIFAAVCRTMAYAHSRGVIHRDLKPANIMVGAFGEVQVVDWGLAKVLARGGKADERRAREEREERTLLETVRSDGSSSGTDSIVGSVIGTPAYMPPEQACGMVDQLDERSDVFALGAILCEVLTGRPPYPGEQEKTILQAAQAELEDVLAALDACEAEPELIKIAKQCLVAARQARPRNAGVLAEAIDAFREGVEERARAAEIAAAEARVQAVQEKRARRLTLALATSVLLLVVLSAGGWVLREERRSAEVERVERALDELRGQVGELQAAGLTEEAVATARGALVLVEGRPPEDALAASAASLVAAAEEYAAREEARLAEVARNTALLERLEELGLEAALADGEEENRALEPRFAEAFLEWGLDVDADIERALEVLRASPLAEELAPAFDDWASVRRRAFGWSSFEAEAMVSLAADLDPDPMRVRLREALMERDIRSLIDMALERETGALPASTAWVLGNALRDLESTGSGKLALGHLERAISAHPDDLRLRMAAALLAIDLELYEVALPHVSAAVALREDVPPALAVAEGWVLCELSRFPAAVRSADRSIERYPDDWRLHLRRGLALFELGKSVEAVESLERAVELGVRSADLEILLISARYMAGFVDLDEMSARLKALDLPGAELPAAYLNAFDEDGDLAYARRVVERMRESAGPPLAVHAIALLVEGELALASGDPAAALDAADRLAAWSESWVPPGDRAEGEALATRALIRLGRREEARRRFLAVDRAVQHLLLDDPNAWETSMLLQHLERTLAELDG